MDFEEIKLILAMVREHDLAEFELEHQGFKIRIRKDGGHPIVVTAPVAAAAVAPAVAAQAPAASSPAASAEPADAPMFPPSATLCHKCNTKALVLMDGCQTCLNCGYSKCG